MLVGCGRAVVNAGSAARGFRERRRTNANEDLAEGVSSKSEQIKL